MSYAAQAWSSGSGSIGAEAVVAHQPLTQISKCRCGPEEAPVEPTAPTRWPATHGRVLGDGDRAGLEVHEDVVAAVVAADDDVVAGAGGLVGDPVHDAADRRDDGEALGGDDVLALVRVAGAAGAEAGVRAAERVRALDGEEL